ncbi:MULTISPECIES: DUF6985 domain-containing protein [Paenibacillus]|uniref:DUF6985 domain-containing protein n=1 Tax=Paenibacillus xylanilyticus TaxID=248903 RepID=A0A7Y6C369_9BACL|nr:hypothetical protein [Paenibacillus xylanilyticus]NUU79782.1 hypothetical protein [Paenibacillus xylanilyticus]
MTGRFHLERIGAEDPSDENRMSGYGLLNLFHCEVEYRFNTEDMSLEEAELYIRDVLNRLPDGTINDICKLAYEWKTEKILSDTVEYAAGLAEAEGRDILEFMSVGEVELFRNPYDQNDDILGAILGGGTEWDAENGMEIVVRGDKVLEVREYLGYGAFAIWTESDENE